MDTRILEKEVLGYVLLQPSLLPNAMSVVDSRCFTVGTFKVLYDLMKVLYKKRLKVEYNNLSTEINSKYSKDPTMIEALQDALLLVRDQGLKFNAPLFDEKLHSLAFPLWSRETRERAHLVIHEVLDKDISNAEKVEEIRRRFNNRLDSAPVPKNKRNKGRQFLAKMQQGTIPSIRTQWKEFNKLVGNFFESQFIIVAARPAMGKSSFIYNIANHYLEKYDDACVLFSLEINADGIYKRMGSIKTGVDPRKLRTVKGLTKGERQDFEDTIMEFSEMEDIHKFNIECDGSYNLATIENEIRLLSKSHKVGLVIVDYIQLVMAPGNPYERTTRISQKLKEIARKYNVVMIGVAQLSREVEKRQNKRPIMSDLRDSGSLEQDADKIIMLYREDYYERDKAPTNIVECDVVKNREGATGVAKLKIDLVTGRIHE